MIIYEIRLRSGGGFFADDPKLGRGIPDAGISVSAQIATRKDHLWTQLNDIARELKTHEKPFKTRVRIPTGAIDYIIEHEVS